jgi:hypothetical protein
MWPHSGSEKDELSWQSAFWYENQFADADSTHINFGGALGHAHHDPRSVGHFAYVGPSPVHTVYVTAQSLNRDENPSAEVRLRATVERTWDGRTNVLDFSWDLMY